MTACAINGEETRAWMQISSALYSWNREKINFVQILKKIIYSTAVLILNMNNKTESMKNLIYYYINDTN